MNNNDIYRKKIIREYKILFFFSLMIMIFLIFLNYRNNKNDNIIISIFDGFLTLLITSESLVVSYFYWQLEGFKDKNPKWKNMSKKVLSFFPGIIISLLISVFIWNYTQNLLIHQINIGLCTYFMFLFVILSIKFMNIYQKTLLMDENVLKQIIEKILNNKKLDYDFSKKTSEFLNAIELNFDIKSSKINVKIVKFQKITHLNIKTDGPNSKLLFYELLNNIELEIDRYFTSISLY